MMTDKLSMFADGVSLVGATGSALVGNQMDLASVQTARGDDWQFLGYNSNMPLYLVIVITEAVDSSGDGSTVQFSLRSDDSATISTTTSTVHYQTGAIAEAALVAGAVVAVVQVPIEGIDYEEFLGVVVTRGGEAVTAGAFDAFLTPTPPAWRAIRENAGV